MLYIYIYIYKLSLRFLYGAFLNIHRWLNIANITPHGPDYGSVEPKCYSVDFLKDLSFHLDYLVINFSTHTHTHTDIYICIYIYIYIYMCVCVCVSSCYWTVTKASIFCLMIPLFLTKIQHLGRPMAIYFIFFLNFSKHFTKVSFRITVNCLRVLSLISILILLILLYSYWRNNKRRVKTSLTKYLPLTLLQGFEKFVWGFTVRGSRRPNINCNILTPLLWPSRCVFLVL